MTTDTRTTNKNYPLPYPSNLLAADVVRLRDALTAIDTDMAATVSTADVTAAVDAAVTDLLDSAPANLDTLNELAAALGDDANFSATVTAALAARLQLAGGTMTGAIDMGSNAITGLAAPTNANDAATKVFVETTVEEGPAQWTAINSAQTLEANKRYLVDSSAASFTLDLPASPTAGQFVTIADSEGCFVLYPVTIAQNGTNIVGQAADLVANVDRAVITLIYSGDATTGWLVK